MVWFASRGSEEIVEFLLNLNFKLFLLFILLFYKSLLVFFLVKFIFHQFLFEFMVLLLKLRIFFQHFGEFIRWFEELFLVDLCAWWVFKFKLMGKKLDTLLVGLKFMVESNYLEFKFLIFAFILFDELFCCLQCVLSKETLRFQVLDILVLLNYAFAWFLIQLLFYRLQRGYIHHCLYAVKVLLSSEIFLFDTNYE